MWNLTIHPLSGPNILVGTPPSVHSLQDSVSSLAHCPLSNSNRCGISQNKHETETGTLPNELLLFIFLSFVIIHSCLVTVSCRRRNKHETKTRTLPNELLRFSFCNHSFVFTFFVMQDMVLCKIYRKATSLKVLEQRAAMEEEDARLFQASLQIPSELDNLTEPQVPNLNMDWSQDLVWTQFCSPWLQTLTPSASLLNFQCFHRELGYLF